MFKVFRYSFIDLVRSPWTVVYLLFFALAGGGLFYLSGTGSKVLVSLMNVVILLVPLISMIYGLMYLYQVRDYVEILLAQPIGRRSVFGGYYLGLATALGLSALLGLALPVLWYQPAALLQPAWLLLLGLAVALTFIFSALACGLVIRHDNRLRGFGLGLFWWLLLAVLYDGVVLTLLISLQEYPVEKLALVLTLLNPIDAGRILLIFQLDFSALMGYTGAVFQKFLGTSLGSLILGGAFLLWWLIPYGVMARRAQRKDF